jgi:ABC-type transport system substrate-binding protein
VIGERSEPAGLLPVDNSYVNQLIGALLYGLDVAEWNYDYVPVLLKLLPTQENGGAALSSVEVRQGESIVDVNGKALSLAPGTVIRNALGDEVVYTGQKAEMQQLVTTYEFVDGLLWSDGQPVVQADYELAYRGFCDPGLYETTYLNQPAACERIEKVEYLSDTAYRVTWKPGYLEPGYVLPPISRMPSHLTLSDGRRLADVSPSDWAWLEEVNNKPLSVGPYILSEWKFGERMVLHANPYYYLGKPRTLEIVIRFIPQAQTATYLLNGQVDLLGWDSLLPEQIPALLEAQSQGKARLYIVPSTVYELIGIALWKK